MKAEEKWVGKIKSKDGTFQERVISDEVERLFWKDFILKRKEKFDLDDKVDDYSNEVFKELKKIIDEVTPQSILEIGPGYGNYTLRLSKECTSLTLVDISKDILNYLEEKCIRNGIDNVTYINSKIEDLKIDEGFDLVFAYNCFYRVLDIKDVLYKMVSLANKTCVIGMNSDIYRNTLKSFKDNLNLTIKENVLSHKMMGEVLKECGVPYEEIEKKVHREYRFKTIEEAIEYEKSFITEMDYDVKKVEEIVRSNYRLIDGEYVQEHYITFGFLVIRK